MNKRLTILMAVLTAVVLQVAMAEMSFSDVSASGTSVGGATISATVTGTGRVLAEYAHNKMDDVRSVKERYVQTGLVAMWDAVDNMGTGVHDPAAITWRDLTGNHVDMTFTAPPTIGLNFYDLSKGGCGVAAPEIARLIDSGSATVEIVCKVRSFVTDGTLVACVDGTDAKTGAAGNRIFWVRNVDGAEGRGVLGAVEYRQSAWSSSQLVDKKVGEMRSYVFRFNTTDGCVVATNGAWALTKTRGNVAGVTANGWFSLGQRISASGSSAAISDVNVYSVRVYDHYLTESERQANYAADRERFFDIPTPIDLDKPGAAVKETAYVGAVKGLITNAKDFYVTDGLIAMWDGDDNQGVGTHVANATTWVDLTDNHVAMEFDAAPTVGDTYYDVSRGGGYVKSCVDIAQALQNKDATIEIVCDVRSFVDSGTLVSVVDGTGSDAGNRLAWIMNGELGSNHQGTLGTIDYLTRGSTTPYPSYDTDLNAVRAYSLKFASDACYVYRNGSSTVGKSKIIGNEDRTITLGNAETACFSIGQRFSQGGKSSVISDMRVYCVRVYNRHLTAGEVAANHAVDTKRFFGMTNEFPLGCYFAVENPDGTKTICREQAVFKLSGLRADITPYTVRLVMEDGAAKSSGVVFETASERPASTWYEFLDSRLSTVAGGPAINLGYVSKGHVPVVETRYQFLSKDDSFNQGVFGAVVDLLSGAYVLRLPYNNVSSLRYRVADAGGYEPLTSDEITGVHDLVFNGAHGTVLNGRTLDMAGIVDTCSTAWGLFGRRIDAGAGNIYHEPSKVRIWSFKLWSDGNEVFDLVPACRPDGTATMFDRISNTCFENASLDAIPFMHGPDLTAPTLEGSCFEGAVFKATLKRTGAKASELYVAYGAAHGGADLSAWEHCEKLPTGFSDDETELAVSFRGIDPDAIRYVRFYSVADGWSASVYVPDTKRCHAGLLLIVK